MAVHYDSPRHPGGRGARGADGGVAAQGLPRARRRAPPLEGRARLRGCAVRRRPSWPWCPRKRSTRRNACSRACPSSTPSAPGGARRQDSVLAGLKQAPAGFDGVVLVHDAARPFADVATIEAVARAAAEHGAALPVLPLVDTVKRVRDGRVVETLDRSELGAAQTPQGFRLPLLTRAYEAAFRDRVTVTDEAMAVERLGAPVVAVPGSARNRKLTTPEDLAWAEGVLPPAGRERAREPPRGPRLRRPSPRRRAGRSCWAASSCPPTAASKATPTATASSTPSATRCSGAAAAGDMGQHFPSADPRWKGAPSRVFVEEVARLLRDSRLRGRERRRDRGGAGADPGSPSRQDAREPGLAPGSLPGRRLREGQEHRRARVPSAAAKGSPPRPWRCCGVGRDRCA